MKNFENNRNDNDKMYQPEFDYLCGIKMLYLCYCSSTTVFFSFLHSTYVR